MADKKKKLNLYVYKKVILVFTALIIPVYLVNAWINIIGLNFIKEQNAGSNTYNLNFYANQLNDQMYFIRNLQLQLLNDSDLQKLSFRADFLDSFETLELVNSIKERLQTIQNSSDYLHNVGVYIKASHMTISTRKGFSNIPNEESELVLSIMEEKPKRSLYFINGRLFFVEFSNRSSIASYMELSVPQLQATLNHLVKHESSGVVLTDNQFSQRISSHYQERIVSAIRDSNRQEIDPSFDSYLVQSDGSNYQVSLQFIPSMGWTIYTYSDQDELTNKLRKFNIWFIVLSVFSVVVILIFSYSVNRMIHRPLHKLIRAFRMMETNHPRLSAKWDEVSEFDYLYQGFDSMVETLNKSIHENYEHKIALQNSELKQLQSQINPHFLYNSFYNIYRLCKIGDYEHVSVLTQKLASYYQFITRSGTDEVPLDKEYRHAKDYCEIQSIRFANRIQVKMSDLPEECKPLMVPRLIIQPIIENAFEHALDSSAKPGHIVVSIHREQHRISFCVEDNGKGMPEAQLLELQKKLDNPSETLEKTGLINVSRRLRLKYGKQSGVSVSRGAYGGLRVDIVLEYAVGGEKDA
jgi:two-component system sensor histidine kinase YesM